MPLPFLFLLFFVMNKTTTTSLLSSQNFPFLPTSPVLRIYLTSFCAHSIVRAQESLKWEGRSESKNEKVEWKLEGKFFPFSWFFLVVFLHVLSFLCLRRRKQW